MIVEKSFFDENRLIKYEAPKLKLIDLRVEEQLMACSCTANQLRYPECSETNFMGSPPS